MILEFFPEILQFKESCNLIEEDRSGLKTINFTRYGVWARKPILLIRSFNLDYSQKNQWQIFLKNEIISHFRPIWLKETLFSITKSEKFWENDPILRKWVTNVRIQGRKFGQTESNSLVTTFTRCSYSSTRIYSARKIWEINLLLINTYEIKTIDTGRVHLLWAFPISETLQSFFNYFTYI